MQEDDFKTWLRAQRNVETSVSTRISDARRVELHYGDLDAAYADDQCTAIVASLTYSKADEHAGKDNSSRIPVTGNIYNSLASYRAATVAYAKFKEAEAPAGSARSILTREAVLAAMGECDSVGLDEFLILHGFGMPRDYWTLKPGSATRYPAKAIVGVAHGLVPGGRILTNEEFSGGNGQASANTILRRLGFEIVGGSEPAPLVRPVDQIRQFVIDNYIKPARVRGDNAVDVVSGDVHRTMRLENAMPSVCQALDGKIFAKEANVELIDRHGPNASSTVRYRYRLTKTDRIQEASPRTIAFQSEPPMPPTNLILYGPPGTGKTYTTAVEAVRLCGEEVPRDRDELMALYRSLQHKGRIGFVTFHQNFSYEDFVEGLRPATGDGAEGGAGFSLSPEPGVFRRIADMAAKPVASSTAFSFDDRRIFKLSLGESGKAAWNWVYEQSIEDGYALFGFRDVDWSDERFSNREAILAELQSWFPDEKITPQTGIVKSPDRFRNQIGIGDVVIISKGLNAFRAIGVVEGDYEYAPREGGSYCHRRKVRWLWEEPEGVPVGEISATRFSLDTVYELPRERLNLDVLARYIAGADEEAQDSGDLLPHVLIIDEINRANISKVFGELITLLEPDKRLGMPNALTVRLPYSKTEFGVPANLHVIGTMNTADRSIALLDTALRRRFTFREMAPRPDLLGTVDGIDLKALLTAINRRIEYLLDREHRIGHAFFMGLSSRADIDEVMRDKVIPLLQEYFFEDWGRIRAVLGSGFIGVATLPPPPGMKDLQSRETWFVRWDEPANPKAFPANAYGLLLSGAEPLSAGEDDAEAESQGA